MSKTECKRCGGEGMGQHSRAQGMCYLCGRMPGGEARTPVAVAMTARAASIKVLADYLAAGASRVGTPHFADWLDAVTTEDADGMPTIAQMIAAAPADVAARARAAFARLGVAP